MKIKKIIVILLALITLNSAYAQRHNKKSNVILKELADKTKSYKTIKINFIYKMVNKSAKINESKKGILIVKGDKYKLNIENQTVICDGKTIWTYLEDNNEVMINSAADNDDSFSPSDLLASYNKDYKSRFIKERKRKSKIIQIIDLIPLKTKERSFTKIRLKIDKTKKQIISSSIHDRNGSIYTYQINKFITNLNFKDSEFNFNPADHPGVEINDMR